VPKMNFLGDGFHKYDKSITDRQTDGHGQMRLKTLARRIRVW